MKIGIIAPPWVPIPPLAYGGTELVIDTLARGLSVAGHEVLLYATGDSTCPVETKYLLEEAEGKNIANSTVEIRHLIKAYEAMNEAGVDIIHDHTMVGPVYGPAVTDIPIVTTNHNTFSVHTEELWRAVTDSDVKIISISHNHASHACAQVRVDKVIHHGIDTTRFPDGSGEGGYLAFLGRMVPEKGVHTAIAVAKAAGVPLKIGAKMREAPEREYFESQVKPLLDGDIEYLGELGPKDKLELLSGAKAMINPIRWPEPFGMVMIESLACGTPVIVFPSGAAPEIVTDGLTGFVCKDEADMVKAVARLDEISRRACRFEVEQSFSMQRMTQDHVEMYSEMLAEAKAIELKPEKIEISL